ncbi:diguanylate cyclase domain-containing protein [Spirochaeta dissipatitropha]
MDTNTRNKQQSFEQLYDQAYALSGNDPRRGLELVGELSERARENGNLEYQALALYIGGFCHLGLGEYPDALHAFDTGSRFSSEQGLHELEVKFHNAFGTMHFQLGTFADAISEYSEGLRKARLYNLRQDICRLLINLGRISLKTSREEEALRLYLEAESCLEDDDPPFLASVLYSNLGEAYLKNNQLKKARELTLRSLEYAREHGVLSNEITDMVRLGHISADSGDFDAAVSIARQALLLAENRGFKELKIKCLLLIGSALAGEGKFKDARAAYNASMRQIKKYEVSHLLADAYEQRAEINKRLGCYAEAYDDMTKAMGLSRDWLRAESSTRLEQLETAYHLDGMRHEAELERQRRQSLERANAHLQAVTRIGVVLTSTLQPEEILTRMWRELSVIFPLFSLAIGVYNRDNETVEFPLLIDDGQLQSSFTVYMSDEQSLAAYCIRKGKTQYFRNSDEARRYINRPEVAETPGAQTSQSMLFIPMYSRDEVSGVLTIQSLEVDVFSQDIVEMLEAIAVFAGVAVENAWNMGRMESRHRKVLSEKVRIQKQAAQTAWLADHDGLTRLANRRFLDKFLEDKVSNNKTFALFYMDLDGFKPVNDQYGHEIGDRVLVMAAERLKGLFRSSDRLCRVGGDEFVAVVVDVEKEEDCILIQDKIFSAFKEPFKLDNGTISLSISSGFSRYPADTSDIGSLLSNADAAMYRDKQSPD